MCPHPDTDNAYLGNVIADKDSFAIEFTFEGFHRFFRTAKIRFVGSKGNVGLIITYFGLNNIIDHNLSLCKMCENLRRIAGLIIDTV